MGGSTGGADLAGFCDTAVAGIDADRPVIGYGPTAGPEIAGRVAAQQALFDNFVTRSTVPRYAGSDTGSQPVSAP